MPITTKMRRPASSAGFDDRFNPATKKTKPKIRPNDWHVVENQMRFYGNHEPSLLPFLELCPSSSQNTFATPTAIPTDTVTRRTNRAVVGAMMFNARPFLRGIDAPGIQIAPRSDWYLPPER